MEWLFAKMGLDEAASHLFGALDRNLQPKVFIESLGPEASSANSSTFTQVSNGFIAFSSAPLFKEGWRLRVVLRLNRVAFDSYYALYRRRITRGFETVASLVDATVHEFLKECLEAIESFDADRFLLRLPREPDEVLRAAARRLLSNPAMTNGYGESSAGRLFFDCNAISYMRYERGESNGHLLLARRGHPNVQDVLTRCTPLPMGDHRGVRKLLELASGDVAVSADAYQVYGLARLAGDYSEPSQDLFSIRFIGQSHWEFYHGKHLMMRVIDGRPVLPDVHVESRFKAHLRSLFPALGEERIDVLWRLADEAASARHGAMLVISDGASSEATRLETSCTRVEPIKLTPELMRRVCSIDGAVLIDASATCYAIGVILDGLALEGGDSARGSRYNSAVRYACTTSHRCLVAVVSEDGGADIITSPQHQA